MDLDRIEKLLNQRRHNHALPQAFYVDPEILQFDLEAVYANSWLMAGFEAEVPEAGSTMTFTAGMTSIIIVRDMHGELRAFHNSCRHRGSELLAEGCSQARRLICPYHQWTYGLDGRLIGARQMPPGFDRGLHGLIGVHLETVAGMIYVCLADEPPSFERFRAEAEAVLGPHDLKNARIAFAADVVERANWKLVMENARECYHCAVGHPNLRMTFPIDYFGAPGAEELARVERFRERMAGLGLATGPYEGEWWQIERFALNEGCTSISEDGQHVSQPLMCAVGGGDLGSVRLSIEPHSFCHATADYMLSFSAMPTTPVESVVRLKFLVHKDAVEGRDYDLDRLIETWNLTNNQDRDLAEANQRGVNSVGYRPGPYSEDTEQNVMRLVNYYCDKARAYLERRRDRRTASLADAAE